MTEPENLPVSPMSPLSPHLVCADSTAEIAFLQAAFGATELMRLPGPSGEIVHAAVEVRGATVLLVDEMEMTNPSPTTLGSTPVTLHLMVDDADAVIADAVAAGATVVLPAEDAFWGDRYGIVADPSGHHWSIASHLTTMSNDEIVQAGQELMQ